MFQPLRKYADFTGRARRMEFWLFWLFLIGIQIVFSILIGMVGGPTAVADPTDPFAVLNGPAKALYGVFGLVMLGLLIPSLAVAMRRLHDTNRTGWWLALGLIPFLGALVLLIFYVLDGTPGPNKYGPDPKGRVSAAAA
ncbi:DUF805 domain-containing protein [Phenylobacterium sp.]|uniref:DUF805 domain-containing protein n=1 Tax=Phenylobacterium sp. TaxID=1871053 RepID=UPI0025F9674F|nr:DUF805 domain-containing protein [Phenylobacterium sp.]